MDKDYAGMTVNERLYANGLMDAFDNAIRTRNSDKVISILKEVMVNEKSIKAILQQYDLI